MSTRPLFVAVLLSLSAGLPVLVTGCANSPHSRTVGTVIDDAALTTRVKSALLAEPDVNSFDISVETLEGSVQLSGFVNSQWQIDKAAQVARSVSGVRQVRNNLVHKSN